MRRHTAPHPRAGGVRPFIGICNVNMSRDRSRRKIKNQENEALSERVKRIIVFSDLRNPPKNFRPLFGEFKKLRTLTEKDEQ